jgi:hypothetical protein
VYARLHTLETTPETYEQGLEIVRDQLLPWASESTGFRGLIGLVDDARETALVLTLWDDEESLEQGAAAGDRLSLRAAQASGATRRALQTFEVAVYELPGARD